MKIIKLLAAFVLISVTQLPAMQEIVHEEQIFDEFNYFDSIHYTGLFQDPKLLAGIRARHIPTMRTFTIFFNMKINKAQGYHQEENEIETATHLQDSKSAVFFSKLWLINSRNSISDKEKKRHLDELHALVKK